MDLSKMKDEKKVDLCRWYFRAGFAFLPFVWLINTIWFYGEAFRKPQFEGQADIKRYRIVFTVTIFGDASWAEYPYRAPAIHVISLVDSSLHLFLYDVIYSGIGALVWAIALASWITVFQVNRTAWGEFADSISFIIPTGIA